jgi:hypothetical protein
MSDAANPSAEATPAIEITSDMIYEGSRAFLSYGALLSRGRLDLVAPMLKAVYSAMRIARQASSEDET